MSVQRTINRELIVHNDFAIGFGTALQTRGSVAVNEQKVEILWIFRTIAEIRALDNTKYTRVLLHVAGAVVEYRFDSSSSATDDAIEVLAPVPLVTGRWLKIFTSATLTFTTTQLADIADLANTSIGKIQGQMVYNTTTNKPAWAKATGAAGLWINADGTTAHTPV